MLCSHRPTIHPPRWLSVLLQAADRQIQASSASQNSLMGNLFGNDTRLENESNLMERWCTLEASWPPVQMCEYVRVFVHANRVEGLIMCLHNAVWCPPPFLLLFLRVCHLYRSLFQFQLLFHSETTSNLKMYPIMPLCVSLIWHFVSQEWCFLAFRSSRISINS